MGARRMSSLGWNGLEAQVKLLEVCHANEILGYLHLGNLSIHTSAIELISAVNAHIFFYMKFIRSEAED